MKRKYWRIILVLVFVVPIVLFFVLSGRTKTYTASQNEVVDLTFAFDKKVEFGEYYFDMSNGEDATYPLCFCLTEKNMFPPDCQGDVKYIYNNDAGTMCVPLYIGKGRCRAKVISSSSFATMFTIPLEYGWTKPYETIVMGIRVPEKAPVGARLVVKITIFKKTDRGNLVPYRIYKQQIKVKNIPS